MAWEAGTHSMKPYPIHILTLLVWLASYNGWAQELTPAQVATGDVQLGSADYQVQTPLAAPYKHGFLMQGKTPAWGHRLHSGLRGSTTLVYSRLRDASQPLFTYTGTGGIFERACFSGKFRTDEPTLADLILLGVYGDGTGLGTGKVTFRDMTFAYGSVGIDVGRNLGDGNCDNLTFDGATKFLGLTECLRVNNSMGMHQRFQAVECRGCETFARFNAGGDLKVSSLFVVGPTTVLKIGTPGPGENNGLFNIGDIKSDQQSGSGFKLLDIAPPVAGEHPSRGRVTFDSGLIAYDSYTADGATLATICGAWRVTLRDYENLQGRTFKLTAVEHKGIQFRPILIIENCTLENGVGETPLDLIHPDSSGYTFVARGCVDSRGKRLPDVEVIR